MSTVQKILIVCNGCGAEGPEIDSRRDWMSVPTLMNLAINAGWNTQMYGTPGHVTKPMDYCPACPVPQKEDG